MWTQPPNMDMWSQGISLSNRFAVLAERKWRLPTAALCSKRLCDLVRINRETKSNSGSLNHRPFERLISLNSPFLKRNSAGLPAIVAPDSTLMPVRVDDTVMPPPVVDKNPNPWIDSKHKGRFYVDSESDLAGFSDDDTDSELADGLPANDDTESEDQNWEAERAWYPCHEDDDACFCEFCWEQQWTDDEWNQWRKEQEEEWNEWQKAEDEEWDEWEDSFFQEPTVWDKEDFSVCGKPPHKLEMLKSQVQSTPPLDRSTKHEPRTFGPSSERSEEFGRLLLPLTGLRKCQWFPTMPTKGVFNCLHPSLAKIDMRAKTKLRQRWAPKQNRLKHSDMSMGQQRIHKAHIKWAQTQGSVDGETLPWLLECKKYDMRAKHGNLWSTIRTKAYLIWCQVFEAHKQRRWRAKRWTRYRKHDRSVKVPSVGKEWNKSLFLSTDWRQAELEEMYRLEGYNPNEDSDPMDSDDTDSMSSDYSVYTGYRGLRGYNSGCSGFLGYDHCGCGMCYGSSDDSQYDQWNFP